MKDKRIFQLHADICQALTHPMRLEIIDCLRDGEKTVTELAEAVEASQGTISRHLSVMRTKGVVIPRREGTYSYYRLGSSRIIAAYDEMHGFAIEYLTSRSELLNT